jgi:type IV secretory pathway VirJ component
MKGALAGLLGLAMLWSGRDAAALGQGAVPVPEAAASQAAPTTAVAAGRPSTAPVEYGLFGTLHLARPDGAITHAVLLFSDRDGWTERQQRLGRALAGAGAFVVGIDLPAYLARLRAIGDACSYPAGHVEEVAHWIERHEGVASYAVPLVVGDGAGATFAYALAAQAPAGTFEGLLTLGWDAALRFPKAWCAGDAGAMTAKAADGFRVVPAPRGLPLAWWPRPFADGARVDGLGALLARPWRWAGLLLPPLRAAGAAAGLASDWRHWRRLEDGAHDALPDDIADLPLGDHAPTAPARDPAGAHRIAIMLTGDGGWAGLDRGVAAALTADGVRVIGFSSLEFFWHRRSADDAAQAIARVIAHYRKDDAQARFVLVGYSFGASLVPVVVNRLPDAARALVDAGVMISPDDTAVFEIHVGDWFGNTHHDDALPIGPEIAASKVPLTCVHGADEDDSFCLTLAPGAARVVALPGGHHYDGDYAALGAAIVRSLAPAPAGPPASAPE